ncbi:MAG: tetratricopeptide repeat protein [Nitrospirae bacterium]|nr:tetratricopeptide repeat protein [Nitrospirota bacterium]MCL5978083.1 tetratricopeptide repeat protein [Nitrospirota bacterium]
MKDDAKSNKTKIIYQSAVQILIIIFIGFFSYSNTLNAPFEFDDEVNIVNNTVIRDFNFFKEPALVRSSTIANNVKYFFHTRYIAYLSFAINYRLHGLDVFGYHVVNIAIHIINAMLVYWFIILSFKTPFFRGSMFAPDSVSSDNRNYAGMIAFFSSIIFVAHPIQTQAVTYIVQRFTSMAAMFYLFSLVFYIESRLITINGQQSAVSSQGKEQKTKHIKFKKWSCYCASIIAAALAMKTKEISFTLPLIIVVYEFLFFDGKIKRRLLYLVPILLTISIIPLSLLTSNPLGTQNIEDAFKIASPKNSISAWDYLITQFRVIVTYIRLMFPPVVQNLDYDYPVYRSFFDVKTVLSFLLLVSLFGFAIYLLRRSSIMDSKGNSILRLSAFGIFWFFITLSVESSIIPIHDVIFEHRVYLPSVGFLTAIVALIISARIFLLDKFVVIGKALVPVLMVTVLIFSGATYARNTIWQDEIKLWEDVVKKSPNKARVHYNLGVVYEKKGRIYEAMDKYLTVIKLSPNHADAYNNLGAAYAKIGRLDKAVENFYFAAKLKPEDDDIQRNFSRASEELVGRNRQ